MDTRSRPPSLALRTNGWIDLSLRWLLGGLFILASIHKIQDPAGFAKIIFGYALFPGAAINLIAILIPYIELTAGIALVAGLYPRASASILGGLLLAFILAISINALRGHVFDCGCFSSGEKSFWPNTPAWLLGRNGLLLVFSGYIVTFQGRRKALISGG